MRSAQRFEPGEKLLVVTKLSEAVVVLRGAVTRLDELGGGMYGVAVEIEKHQIFSLKTNLTQTQPYTAAADELLSPEA
jgi:SpoU rRNA methylase family enzyme